MGTNAAESAPSANRSRSRFGMRKATLKASVCNPAPRRAAKTCSRTRPSRRDTRVRADTSPVARRAPPAGEPGARPTGPSLTSLKPLVILDFCRYWRRSLRGAQRIREEAVSPEPEAQGPKPPQHLAAQGPRQEAPGRPRLGRRRGGQDAAVRHRGPDRQGREEGRHPRQRGLAVRRAASPAGSTPWPRRRPRPRPAPGAGPPAPARLRDRGRERHLVRHAVLHAAVGRAQGAKGPLQVGLRPAPRRPAARRPP